MFTIQDYPKSYGDIRPSHYRLMNFQNTNVDIEKIESKLWEFIFATASSKRPREIYESYLFMNAGWEWSVFRKDNQTVIKIPAGIFPEVNEKQYLTNSKFAYQKILDYFPAKFVAQTTFTRIKNSLNLIEQTFIDGQDNGLISYDTKNLELLANIEIFLNYALEMLDGYKWLPDFDIRKLPKGFGLRNVIIESNVPKIIDFTAYYDIYRLYPQRTIEEVKKKRKHIVDFLDWVNRKRKF